MEQESFTVGDLRDALERLSDDTNIEFGGGLTFYRFKRWGDKAVILEFNEPFGYRTEEFKRRNPNVKAVFIDPTPLPGTAVDDIMLGQVDVEVR